MNKKIILSITFLISTVSLYAGDYKNSEANNIKVVDTFWENILTNPDVSMDLLHDDFQFEFMGICEICQKYNKETYESIWLGKVIPEVLKRHSYKHHQSNSRSRLGHLYRRG